LSSTQSPIPPQLQIDVHDAYKIRFGHSTYAWKEEEIKFPMTPFPGPNKIVHDKKCRNNFNIQSPTCLGVVYIKTYAQVAYNIQLRHSYTPWKVKETTFEIEVVPCPNSSGINGNRRNNWTSRICLSDALPFLAFVSCIVSRLLGLRLGGTCTSLDTL
jgi:hypothetical protein